MDGNGGGGGGVLPFYHVPQKSRREKLRYPTNELLDLSPPPHLLQHHANPSLFMPPSTSLLNPSYSGGGGTHFDSLFAQQGVSLSLSSYNTMVATDPRISGVPRAVAVAAAAPSEPFTGYAAVLKASRYLRPAQQMLEEICNVGGGYDHMALPTELGLDEPGDQSGCGGPLAGASGEHGRVKSRLICMMDEVYRRYKQYYQQIQYVMTSFESVAGLSNAAPYASSTLKSLTKHFRGLKDAISDQLRFTDKSCGKESQSKEEMHGYRPSINGGLCYQGVTHSSGAIGQPNVWRPQRGLPERAVAVLKAWLFEHFLHPYPTDTDKHMLAKQTGLSRNQVSNWFINARVRLWKPLVEEIHSLEMRQARKVSDADSSDCGNQQQPQLPSASLETNTSKKPVQSIGGAEKNEDPPHKRFRNEFAELSNHNVEEPIGISFDDFQSHNRMGGSIGIPSAGGNTGISLTLGLHQNNGICIRDPLPLNVARRFGLEDSSGASYVMGGGYEAQERHFGKDIDGQLLRDFVG